MRLEFCCKIADSDYLYLRNNDILDIVWTSQDAIIWLQDLNYYYEFVEMFHEELNEWWTILTFEIDEHTLDFLLLQWPRLFETRAGYEEVTLHNESK